ncbi:MAG: hypothetical protein K6F73_03840 [Lachnospiraceae bacterium]|nr:hypothetical protein [Lachnospiraceae bacterium]
MKIGLTSRGKALVKKMTAGSAPRTVREPDMRPFTLIRYSRTGKALPKETVMVDMNKHFRKTA